MDKDINLEPVKDINIENASVGNITDQMSKAGGFSAKKFSDGVRILSEFIVKKDCLKFLSIPAAPISTGLRGVIKHMVKNKMVDVLVSTCGLLDHDIARTFKDYYKGDFMLDDAELGKQGISRLGSVLVPNESYGILLEDVFKKFLDDLYKKGHRNISTKDFCFEIGKLLENQEKKDDSILYWAYKNDIPVFIPAPTDGSVGSQVWMFNQKHKDFTFDVIKDEHLLSELVYEAESTAALIIGGGVSKHHVIWWSQFNGGLDYAVYISTAVEYDGSLSGAQTREAISWNKLKENAKHVTIEGDATLILPFMVAAVEEKIKG
ncbi:MAG: deoxyhypusine synthase [Candidatus Woesearchaeota archaeon]|jgi:deoxyhypusine synthase|nr:deoxyhypusine synthase [Candidatus Woesearchaeota archaeon]|tara:strand:+ start:10597 stop:11556 length:960 start_codon:yes stop_codon:yes gene_type:complete